MVDEVNKDDGKGGTDPANNREYGGVIQMDGKLKIATPGEVSNPLSDVNPSIYLTSYKTEPTFHSHPSGTASDATRNGAYKQAPSYGKDKDINNSGSAVHYVFGRGNGIVYIHNIQGVLATIPQIYFATPYNSFNQPKKR